MSDAGRRRGKAPQRRADRVSDEQTHDEGDDERQEEGGHGDAADLPAPRGVQGGRGQRVHQCAEHHERHDGDDEERDQKTIAHVPGEGAPHEERRRVEGCMVTAISIGRLGGRLRGHRDVNSDIDRRMCLPRAV